MLPIMLGYPNITGTLGDISMNSGKATFQTYSGAFTGRGKFGNGYGSGSGGLNGYAVLGFEASDSNNIYCSKNKVQPLAFQILIIIKI